MSALLHKYTPTISAISPRALLVRTVDYHRQPSQDDTEDRVNRQEFNTLGQLVAQWDPRLFGLSEGESGINLHPNKKIWRSLSSHELRVDSVDSGWRASFYGGAEQLLSTWDGRGTERLSEYDKLLRPLALFERAREAPVTHCVEYLVYAGPTINDAIHNRCGRMTRHYDPAGCRMVADYGLLGLAYREVRVFCNSLGTVDWPESEFESALLLESEYYETSWQYDALGSVLIQCDAKGNRQQFKFGLAGQVSEVGVAPAVGAFQLLVKKLSYNAVGLLEFEQAENGVSTSTSYSPVDGRLKQIKSFRIGEVMSPLQDLEISQDPHGNVLWLQDLAQSTRWSKNTKIDAFCMYSYDTLDQLIEASGRENSRSILGPALPGLVTFGAADDTLWRNFQQRYSYDTGGNLTRLEHLPSSGSGYTRDMTIAKYSNHSIYKSLYEPGLGSGFDQRGNLQELESGQLLRWDLRNQLERVTQISHADGTLDEEIYIYDAGGERVRKFSTASAKAVSHTAEVKYLPGLELRHSTATNEKLTIVIVKAGRCEVRWLHWEARGNEAEMPALDQIRFSLVDHLSSSALELSAKGQLLSQEEYYPYGGTSWWAAKNNLEASYKTIRYSGKERDATGLYYYGFRYYAPWLLRWISPDPMDDIDGLNLFRMVRNNPIGLQDADGRFPVGALEVTADAFFGDLMNPMAPGFTEGGWSEPVVWDPVTSGFVRKSIDFNDEPYDDPIMGGPYAIAVFQNEGGGLSIHMNDKGQHAQIQPNPPRFPIFAGSIEQRGSDSAPWWILSNSSGHYKPNFSEQEMMSLVKVLAPDATNIKIRRVPDSEFSSSVRLKDLNSPLEYSKLVNQIKSAGNRKAGLTSYLQEHGLWDAMNSQYPGLMEHLKEIIPSKYVSATDVAFGQVSGTGTHKVGEASDSSAGLQQLPVARSQRATAVPNSKKLRTSRGAKSKCVIS